MNNIPFTLDQLASWLTIGTIAALFFVWLFRGLLEEVAAGMIWKLSCGLKRNDIVYDESGESARVQYVGWLHGELNWFIWEEGNPYPVGSHLESVSNAEMRKRQIRIALPLAEPPVRIRKTLIQANSFIHKPPGDKS
jgi:hypothetical protein